MINLFSHPKTLLGKTVFVIAAVLIITQLFAVFLFRAYNRGPLFEEMASLVTGQLRVIGAALEALPEDERIDFLDILEETQGIRVIPDAAGQLPANEPQSEQLQDFADYLRKELGDGAEFFVQQSGVRRCGSGSASTTKNIGFPFLASKSNAARPGYGLAGWLSLLCLCCLGRMPWCAE